MAPQNRIPRDNSRFAHVVEQLSGGYKTIGQMAYDVLREAILSGALAPGEWLRQEVLAAAIGVSRIPVRTALLQLEAEGLVTFHPHRGARVSTLTSTQINETYRLRGVLESYALRLSMTRMTPERLQVLRACAERLDGEQDGRDYVEARIAFYRALYDAEHNPILFDTIESLRSTVGHYLLGRRMLDSEHEQHALLVDRIEAGDLSAAEAWLFAHLEHVRREIEQRALGAGGEADRVPVRHHDNAAS